MQRKVDIYKAGGVLIKDRKFLITRSKGKSFFIAPGGKLEANENAEEALVRELKEELNIEVDKESLEEFGTFIAPVVRDSDKTIQMYVFFVKAWRGEIEASNEIEEIMWIDSKLPTDLELGSIFAHEVLPRLKELGLID